MNRDHSSDSTRAAQPMRVDKTLQWLATSRDSWKEKAKETKTKLKIATLALKRAREARSQTQAELKEEWRHAQSQLHQKDREIADLKNKLKAADTQLEILKKKR